MTCKYCNAPVTLEDKYCPYCGALNEAAQKHIADMEQYGADYERTREKVLLQTQKQTRSHARFFIVLFLVLLNVIIIACHFGAYDLQDMIENRQINRHADEYREVLNNYEENGEYEMLAEYYNRNSLYMSDNLEEYNAVAMMARDYEYVQEALFYLTHTDQIGYNSENYYLDRIAENLYSFYDSWNFRDTDSSYYAGQFTGNHLSAMEDMKEKMETELKAYCNLTDQDIANLPEMKDSQSILILLGKEMGIYE